MLLNCKIFSQSVTNQIKNDSLTVVCETFLKQSGYVLLSEEKAKQVALDLNDLDYYQKRSLINDTIIQKQTQQVDLLNKEIQTWKHKNRGLKLAIPVSFLVGIVLGHSL